MMESAVLRSEFASVLLCEIRFLHVDPAMTTPLARREFGFAQVWVTACVRIFWASCKQRQKFATLGQQGDRGINFFTV